MKLLLHGDNVTAIRNRLSELKQSVGGEIYSFDAKDISPEILSQSLQSGNLFNDAKRLVIIEKPENNKNLFDNFPEPTETTSLLLIEDKKLSNPQLAKYQKNISGLQIEEYKINPVVFRFLETLKPKGQETFLSLWQEYKVAEEPEIILVMLVRQFRLLLSASDTAKEKLNDFVKLAPWQQTHLRSQAKNFTPERLKSIYHDLLDIDFENKTGQSPLSLTKRLELFLLRL